MLLPLAREGLNDLDARQVLLQDGVEGRKLCWTRVNIGRARLLNKMNSTMVIGRIGRTVSASLVLVLNRMISVPVRSSTAPTSWTRPCPMNSRTFSTSSVARIVN